MAGQRSFDPIAIVERSYALQGSESEWIDRLLEAVGPAIDQSIGVYGFTYRWHGGPSDLHGVREWQSGMGRHPSTNERHGASADYLAGAIDVRKPYYSFSQQVAKLPATKRASGTTTSTVSLVSPMPSWFMRPIPTAESVFFPRVRWNRPCRRGETARWQRITAHMASALRLRRRIEQEKVEDEAVLSPSGSLLHATGVAKQADARERLRIAGARDG